MSRHFLKNLLTFYSKIKVKCEIFFNMVPPIGFGVSMYHSFMDKRKKEKLAPFSLRLSEEERLYLDKVSGNMPLGAYIRSKILNEETPRRAYRKPKKLIKDKQELAKVQAMLGSSRLSNNLNQLAKAMNSGSLPANTETYEALLQACADITLMRNALMRALGLRPPK